MQSFRGKVSERNTVDSTQVEGVLRMKQRPRIYYSESQKAAMSEPWQRSEPMHAIARLFDSRLTAIRGILAPTGGIRLYEQRQRSALVCLLSGRMQISRKTTWNSTTQDESRGCTGKGTGGFARPQSRSESGPGATDRAIIRPMHGMYSASGAPVWA